MEFQYVLNLAAGLMFGVVGWFGREMWGAVKELKNDLAKLREELPKTYLPKDDFKDSIREIKEMLQDIQRELKQKADK